MKLYKKLTLFISIILNYQLTIFGAGDYKMVPQESDHGISLKAENFPILVEGFQLCGRYDLQDFFNQKLQALNPGIQNNAHNSMNESINTFTIIGNITESAQAEIITILSNDKLSAEKFCTTLQYITIWNLDIKKPSRPSLFPCINYHGNQLFQYCIHVDFMHPVVEKYLIYCDAQSRDESTLPFWKIGIYYNRPQIIELYMNCSDVYKDALQNKFDLAVDYGADKIIPILAAGDKNINKQDAKGNTPLHNLVLRISDKSICPELIFRPYSGLIPNKHVVIALIAAGADLQKRNNDEKRPWDLAEFEEIRDLLQPIPAENTNSYCTIS